MSAAPRAVLVTGGASGIGKAIGEELAAHGWAVGINDLAASAGEGRRTVRALARRGRAQWCPGDVSTLAGAREAVGAAAQAFGRLDALVNNAGVFDDAISWHMTPLQWDRVIQTDLTGPFYCCQQAMPWLKRSPAGRIVNIGSINGLRGKVGQANYAAAKAGVIGLTKTLARELGRDGVTVNAVAPGWIETPATARAPRWAREAAKEEAVLKRLGEPRDVARVVRFLVSEDARQITGEVIRVDGGQYL